MPPLAALAKYKDPTYRPRDCYVVIDRGCCQFVPIATKRLKTYARLEILFMRPEPPGSLVAHGGDIDNRVKTVLDALRVPGQDELNSLRLPQPAVHGDQDDNLFYCLLEDDALVSGYTVDTDFLLDDREDNGNLEAENQHSGHCLVIVRATIKAVEATLANIAIVT